MSIAPFPRIYIDLVREQAQHAPDALTLIYPKGCFTFPDLFLELARVADALKRGCVVLGDRASILIRNRVEWLYVALWRAALPLTVVRKLQHSELKKWR